MIPQAAFAQFAPGWISATGALARLPGWRRLRWSAQLDSNRPECTEQLAACSENPWKNPFNYQISAPRVPRMGHLYLWQLWEHCRFLGSGTWLLVYAATSRRSSVSAARRSFSCPVDHPYRHTWSCRTGSWRRRTTSLDAGCGDLCLTRGV